ncbi:hypothetical protein B5S31_g4541 [[Candida] boidinii]|nr:hypothetical protein B5S31_g4541 [[Candida] boidinii]
MSQRSQIPLSNITNKRPTSASLDKKSDSRSMTYGSKSVERPTSYGSTASISTTTTPTRLSNRATTKSLSLSESRISKVTRSGSGLSSPVRNQTVRSSNGFTGRQLRRKSRDLSANSGALLSKINDSLTSQTDNITISKNLKFENATKSTTNTSSKPDTNKILVSGLKTSAPVPDVISRLTSGNAPKLCPQRLEEKQTPNDSITHGAHMTVHKSATHEITPNANSKALSENKKTNDLSQIKIRELIKENTKMMMKISENQGIIINYMKKLEKDGII